MNLRRTSAPLAMAMTMLIHIPMFAFPSNSRCYNQGNRLQLGAMTCLPLSTPTCAPGLEAARGRLLDEHAYITEWAMTIAGLGSPDFLFAPAFPDYYTVDDPVPGAIGTLTLEPTGPGWMLKKVTSAKDRPITIPELAQLPDVSYGLADYLLGNEHCLAENGPNGNRENINECHALAPHMGSVNSIHFSPQNRAVYNIYHQLALAVATRCKAMYAAIQNPSNEPANPLLSREGFHPDVLSCEKEALVLETIGSHYLQDAWSTGHMWQRWGQPMFPADEPGRYRSIAVAIVSGMQHGIRGVFGALIKDDNSTEDNYLKVIQHDQLNMPGPFFQNERGVEWTYGSNSPTHPGAGDIYLRTCMARPNNPMSLEDSPELLYQRDRMISCVASGYQEVYNAGPQSRGPIQTSMPDMFITSSTQDACWNQRVTNNSMLLGSGLSFFKESHTNPTVIAGLTGGILAQQHLTPLAGAETTFNALRMDLIKYTLQLSLAANKSPDGIEMAEMEGGVTVLGFAKNSAYVNQITSGQVTYLEKPDAAAWTSNFTGKACADDANCAPSEYCARAAPEAGGNHCQVKEAAILSAFHGAEIPQWCSLNSPDSLKAAAVACQTGRGPDACDACVDLVLPHLRNACDAGSYSPRVKALLANDLRMLDHRSICDVYRDNQLVNGEIQPIYVPFDPDVQGAGQAAAGKWCKNVKTITDTDFLYDFSDLPPVQAQELHDPNTSLCATENTCGGGMGSHWWRLKDDATNQQNAHTHTFTLKTKALQLPDGTLQQATVDQLEVKAFIGPNCTMPLGLALQPVDKYTERFDWTIPPGAVSSTCIRVKPKDKGYDVWTSYSLTDGAVEANCGKAREVRTGSFQTCAVKGDGSVWCWGARGCPAGYACTKRQKDGPWNLPPALVPQLIPRTDVIGMTHVLTGGGYVFGVSRAMNLWQWDITTYGDMNPRLDRPTLVIDSATGQPFSDVADIEGHYQLLIDLNAYQWNSPTKSLTVQGVQSLSSNSNFTYGCVVAGGGTVKCWGFFPGWNDSYKTQEQATPMLNVPSSVQASGSGAVGCAVASDSNLWCWGDNMFGQLGKLASFPNTSVEAPFKVSGIADVVRVSVGVLFTCAVKKDGTVWCMGYNNEGECGNGGMIAPMAWPPLMLSAPTRVDGITNAVDVSVGWNHACALKSNGTVSCWGWNADGQLGNNSTVPSSTPVDVKF